MSLETCIVQSGFSELQPRCQTILNEMEIKNTFQLNTGGSSGLVLTSDASGNAIWAPDTFSSLSANIPLSYASNNLSLGYTNNMSLLAGSLDTAQDLKVTSDVKFASSIVNTLKTGPINSATATGAFGSLTRGVEKKNTLGYDVLLLLNVEVTSVNPFTINVGVGPTSPTLVFAVSADTSSNQWVIPIYLPKNYIVVYDITGTIAFTASTSVVFPV